MTTIYTVIKTVGGYAREDAAEASCEGVFSSRELADKVARVCFGKVVEVTLDYVAPGYAAYYKEIFNKDIK